MEMQLVNASKTYWIEDQPIQALDQVNLTVRQGEFISVVGHSGSGKTTLMNVLGCLDLLDEGQYLIDRKDVNEISSAKLSKIRNQSIGFVFQQFHLIPSMTALENVELPLFYRGGTSRQQRDEAARQALEDVGLGERMHHLPSQMSGGQQQRVAIARAIVANPAVILADEPTGNLDVASGQMVMQILQQLHQQGKTVLLITHDLTVANAAQKIWRISGGKLSKEDTKTFENDL